MASRKHRNYLSSVITPRSPASPQPRITKSSYKPKLPPSYPDAWDSQDDSQHLSRVELFRRRRDSIASSGYSRPTTPSTARSTSSTIPQLGEVSGIWRSNAPWVRERPPSSSMSSDIDTTSEACMSPVELRDELDRYDRQSQFLTRQEWVPPPTPRGRVRRMDPKQFNNEKIRALKRWNGVQGFMYGLNSSTLRETDIRRPPEAYGVGVIFSAPLHAPAGTEEMHISNDDPNLTATPFGTVHSKYRKMVVLRVFGEHVQCLPIYTHNGRGLEGKEFPREYVSIRDLGDRRPEADEGPHLGLRASRDNKYEGTFISGRSVIKLTEIYSHRYESPATIEGRLDLSSDSKRRLFDLVELLGM
ncbi:hypothetical protein F4776DRAFT_41751 [Hypoxylon sp. NC0597]|nr:hypothetical protein F4776DRAFT_41751 [Hypoxylon sp. NC0597]